MKEGDYLVARPACYRICWADEGLVRAEILAPSDLVRGRVITMARGEVEASIRLGDLQLVSERPAWLDPPAATPTGTAKKRARAQSQGRLG